MSEEVDPGHPKSPNSILRDFVGVRGPECLRPGRRLYTAKAMLQGKGRDIWEMTVENIP